MYYKQLPNETNKTGEMRIIYQKFGEIMNVVCRHILTLNPDFQIEVWSKWYYTEQQWV
jgi:hypothetical protein